MNKAQRIIVELLGGDPDKVVPPDTEHEGMVYLDEGELKSGMLGLGNGDYGLGGKRPPQPGWYLEHPEDAQPIPGDPKSYPWELGEQDPAAGSQQSSGKTIENS